MNVLTPDRQRLKSGILTLDDKKSLSGGFESCFFIKKDKLQELADKMDTAKETAHNSIDRKERNSNVAEYEAENPGSVVDMFLVDKGHANGKEIHVIKDNGIIEIYNADKLLSGGNSFITRLIARGSQISRYYKWVDCKTPSGLISVARSNSDSGRNYW